MLVALEAVTCAPESVGKSDKDQGALSSFFRLFLRFLQGKCNQIKDYC
jgi:hypothetical protein